MRLQLYRSFINAVITEIKDELKKKLKESVWEWLKEQFTGSADELFESLDDLLEDADRAKFTSVLGIQRQKLTDRGESTHSSEANAGVEAGTNAGVKVSFAGKSADRVVTGGEVDYGDILMRVFNVKEVLLRLKSILGHVGIKHLYVFIDDFSELPKDAMEIIVDTLLAPLNNWSDELIKFKVAAYPNRVYYGQIDKTKIDEIYLDLYRLYGTTDVSAMEDKAIDFTRRLVESRLEHFAHCGLAAFVSSNDDLWRLLFYASMGNPRILGYLLYYLHESHLIFESPIGSKAIRDAAQRYYEEKIESYFKMNKFLHESFGERASVFSLKELLQSIVQRARDLKSHRDSIVMRVISISGIPPTSHFHVALEIESLLSTLELNFFMTKYYEMSDRDGRRVAVYALNFGLCQKYSIAFGRPSGHDYRLYFVERIFDDTSILRKFMQDNQEIRCSSCGHTYEMDKLPAIQMFGMQCPECKIGICTVSNLSKRYESMLQEVSPELLLPPTELGILQILETEKRPMIASEIASELDKSYQLVGKRGRTLADRGLVTRGESDQGKRIFEITPLAEASYFNERAEDGLQLAPETAPEN